MAHPLVNISNGSDVCMNHAEVDNTLKIGENSAMTHTGIPTGAV